jgi:YVTN family beta-propeller protein
MTSQSYLERVFRISLAAILLTALALTASPLSTRADGPDPAGGQCGPATPMAHLGAPVQTGTAGPDSATSFDATLPNGRRITPLGVSVEVGEIPLNGVLTPDGKFMVVTNDDERNVGSLAPDYSESEVNGSGLVPGGFALAAINTADMTISSHVMAPTNATPNPGPKVPGVIQSDNTAAYWLGVAIKANPAAPGSYSVYAAGGPSDQVDVYQLDGAGGLMLQARIPVPAPTNPFKPNFGMAAPGGLTLSPDGSKLYVVNNNGNTIVTIDTTTNQVLGQPVPVGFFPYQAVLSPDGKKLYVSNWGVADRNFNQAYQSTYDPTTHIGTGSPYIGGVPGNLFANPVTDQERTSSVSVLDLTGQSGGASISLARQIDGVQIVGGTHPSAMAIATRKGQSALYVTDANEDKLAIIDVAKDSLVKKIDLPSPIPGLATGSFLGLTPNAATVSPDQTRLYVAEAGLNAVAVYDTSKPFEPEFLGRIPTGWYPSGVTLSPDGKFLYVVNLKGPGSPYKFQGAVPGSPDVNLIFGSVQKVDLQALNLNKTSLQVRQNTYKERPADDTNVLWKLQSKIKHVFLILRENKTYDIYFGADAVLNARGANGKPEYANFDAQVPNSKALAEQFVIGDNEYADSEESNAGHSFALAGTSTDYMQKTLTSRFSRPMINTKNEDPEDYPLVGYLFNNLARNGRTFRNYGDMMRLSGYDDGKNPNHCADDPYPGCDPATYDYHNTTPPTVGLGGLFAEDVPALKVLGDNHTDPNYPGWNLNITDQRRADEFIKDMGALIQANAVPSLTHIWLPNDHTSGGYDPRFQVADNDTAVGKIVDFISHSSIWQDSVIFITEDDAQGSPDHVSAHRSYVMVVSPYAKHAQVIHRLSSTVSVPKTIEELLCLPPMNLGDLIANDLADYFTLEPDFTPFSAVQPAAIAPAAPEAMRIAELTARLDTSTYDEDTRPLGQLVALFLFSNKLAGMRSWLGSGAYDVMQNEMYRNALLLVEANPGAADDD